MNLNVLDGPNFSGRTYRLRDWVGLPNDPNIEPTYNKNAYVGPDVVSALSGITPSVEAEFELMAADREAEKEARKAMETLGFGYCLSQNVFTLSGGEQVLVAVLAATAMRPKRLVIDCALEQLSPETRTNLLTYLNELDGELMVADNRLDEWYSGPTNKMHAAPDSPMIHPDVDLKIIQEPCEIELVDLCHWYIKGRPVLKNFNFRFEPGVMYQLKGPNGCGKTTLSKIMTGLIKPISGQIRINGAVVQPWRTPGKFVSYHFQHPDFQLFATSVSAQLTKSSDKNALANWFGLEKHLLDHPLDLPFVLKKRVALAAAIGRRFGLLVLDEPTLGQDRHTSQHIIRLWASGISGAVISHSRFFSNVTEIQLEKR